MCGQYSLDGQNTRSGGGAGGPRGVLYTARSDRTVNMGCRTSELISIAVIKRPFTTFTVGSTATYGKRTCTLHDDPGFEH